MRVVIMVRSGIVALKLAPDNIKIELHDYDIQNIEADNPNREYDGDKFGTYEIIKL